MPVAIRDHPVSGFMVSKEFCLAPEVVIGHHPEHGTVASSLLHAPTVHYLLALAGFRRIADHPFLYTLTEPGRDGQDRAAQAVASLRAAGYRVGADIAAEPDLSSTGRQFPEVDLRLPEPDVIVGLHPQLGIVAAVADGQQPGACVLRAHGFHHDPAWDLHILPGSPVQGLDVVARATAALRQARVTFAVHPRLTALATLASPPKRARPPRPATPPSPSSGPRRRG
jgi:hypothetical protein